jgi:hypothetical protein
MIELYIEREWYTDAAIYIPSSIQRAMIELYIEREWYTDAAIYIPSTIQRAMIDLYIWEQNGVLELQ